MESGRSVLTRWFKEVWAEESDSAIEEMFKPEGQATGLGDDVLQGAADFKAFRDAMLGLIRDVRITIEDHFENESMNAAICLLTGTCKSTGKEVRTNGVCYYSTNGDVITHCDNYWDFIGLFEQLGCLEPGTFGKALAGGEKGISATS